MDLETKNIEVGIIGLGLMGCSICTCMLLAGHKVVAIAPIPIDMDHAEGRITKHLVKSFEEKLTEKEPDFYLKNIEITENYDALKNCKLVIECTLENLDIKNAVYEKVENIVADDAIISSNTSAIPISILQSKLKKPERFLGLHWMEPSHTTRFLEIICGDKTDPSYAEYLYKLAHFWEKEPCLLRKDIRGFITNRLMYSVYREACYLVENGYASVEDVDRSIRNSAGHWLAHAGVFRWMDLTGVAAYHTVMKDLLPTLSNQTEIPKLIDDIVKAGGRGVSNAHGFYDYTPEQAKLWEESYQEFSYEIRDLAKKYPADLGDKI